jgi:hypothetical protein
MSNNRETTLSLNSQKRKSLAIEKAETQELLDTMTSFSGKELTNYNIKTDNVVAVQSTLKKRLLFLEIMIGLNDSLTLINKAA